MLRFALGLLALFSVFLTACISTNKPSAVRHAVVYLTDFGSRDGAVSAMKGVARGVDPELVLEDLSHEIEPFDVWEAAYRLQQTASFWPAKTVFVCVVDPGVGTSRRSIVARTKSGHVFVTPDNGTLTLVDGSLEVSEVREIGEGLRLPGSESSATFHGRDVYSLTGAMLASGGIEFADVGRELEVASMIRLKYPQPELHFAADGTTLLGASGMIPVLDSNFGNVWTNIPTDAGFDELELGTRITVVIRMRGEPVYEASLPWGKSFGEVGLGEPLAYSNSLGRLAFALNQGAFAEAFAISAGTDWTVAVTIER